MQRAVKALIKEGKLNVNTVLFFNYKKAKPSKRPSMEAKKDSDVDIVVFAKIKKKINLDKYEKNLGREIQLFKYNSLSKINSKELKMNILNGYILQGEIK